MPLPSGYRSLRSHHARAEARASRQSARDAPSSDALLKKLLRVIDKALEGALRKERR
jgi:hypothetical protein